MSTEPLPEPDSPELCDLVRQAEDRIIYRYLYERRTNPPRMVEVQEYVESVMGKPHAQTQRRLRNLREVFQLDAERAQGSNEFRYALRGWRAGGRRKRGGISGKLRAQVLEAYGSRCAMCGKTPREDHVKLAIDHKIPVDWGGPTVFENLQPLCQECNHGKQAHFASFDVYKDAIVRAINLDDVHYRIGELLLALHTEDVSIDLINLIAREENRGDPTRRLRELRKIGWDFTFRKKRVGKRTVTYYRLTKSAPWPVEGAAAAIRRTSAKAKDQLEL